MKLPSSIPWLAACLLGAACVSTKDVESLDTSGWASDEGAFAVRILTSSVDADEPEKVERDPDIEYSLAFGSSKSILLGDFMKSGAIEVDGTQGPVLAVRKLAAGDYYFHELNNFHGSAPLGVKFSVRPGRVTYIGDLELRFVERGTFLWKNLSVEFTVGADPASALRELQERYPSMPAMETVPMVLERPSF